MMKLLDIGAAPQNRVAWIDDVKMVAMLWVIFGHTWRLIDCEMPVWLSHFILTFNMPLFVIISGYGCYKGLQKVNNWADIYIYISKLVSRIMVPAVVFQYSVMSLKNLCIQHWMQLGVCLCISCFFILLWIYRKDSQLWEIGQWIAVPIALVNGSFWFLYMIFCVMTVAAIIKPISKYISERTFIIVYPLLTFGLALLFDYIYLKTSDFILYFMIGYYLYMFKTLEKPLFSNIGLAVILLVIGLILTYTLSGDMMNFWDFHFINMLMDGTIYLYVIRYFTAFCISLFFIIVIKKYSTHYTQFSRWGAFTLALYMVHAMTVPFIQKVFDLHLHLNDWQYLLYAIPTTMVWTLCSMLIISVFYRWNLTRILFLGASK